MKIGNVIHICSLTALTVALLGDTANLVADPPRAAELDAARPDTWEPIAARAEGAVDRVASELMAIAKDEKAAPDTRRKAVFLLGRLKTRRSLTFLTENIGMRVPMQLISGDADYAKQTPCYYALGSTGWAGAEAILDSLNTAKPPGELLYFALALRRTLGERFAKAAVDGALANTRSQTRIKNLTAVKTHLLGG